MFDPFAGVISPAGWKRIADGWQGLFREVILQLLPVEQLGRHFDRWLGRPSAELYAMAGLVLIKEFQHWTVPAAMEAVLFRTDVQYALNLEPGFNISQRTFERYLALFERDSALAQAIMVHVTDTLAQVLKLNVSRQRIDSTHVLSDMASFGRTRLMGVAIKRFLHQVQKTTPAEFEALPEELRQRYAASDKRLFAETSTKAEARAKTRQQVAEDLYAIIQQFADHPQHQSRRSYLALLTIFQQQCELVDQKVVVKADVEAEESPAPPAANAEAVVESESAARVESEPAANVESEPAASVEPGGTPLATPACESVEKQVVLKTKTGGNVMQNPSDPGATYSGHKGPGYQVQLSETCHPDNEVQLILAALPQTAVTPDGESLMLVLDDLAARGHQPETALADAIYGSDENVQAAAARGVEVLSPVCGRIEKDASDRLGPEDFVLDPVTHTVTACPAGFVPLESLYFAKTDRVTVKMPPATCASCPLLSRCAMQQKKEVSKLYFTTKEHRLGLRRKNQETPEFRARYSKRSGIEGTNSGLKRRVGLGRLRVRGSPAVHNSLLLKVTGWNILQASTTQTLRALVRERLLQAGRLGGLVAIFSRFVRAKASHWLLRSQITASQRHWRLNPVNAI